MKAEITFAKPDHLESINTIWGLNRATLGMMPKEAFKECIKKKWILVCIVDNFVVGYLQFRYTARTQTLSIVHLCIDKSFRGKGYPEELIDRLVCEYKSKARGIKLNCRSDYNQAISFWNRYNFQPKGRLPSRGNNPNVHLVTWWFSFGTQDLFSFLENAKVKAVLDFNIFAKLMDIQLGDPAKEQIQQLQDDWLVSEVEYYHSSETINEIFRDKDIERHERSKAFLKQFPELNIDKPSIKIIEDELQSIFVGNSDNDRSDRRQVSEAILSGFPYFVTLDEGILKYSKSVSEKYHLRIVQPSTLISEIDIALNAEDYYPNKLSGNNFYIGKLRPDERDGLDQIFLHTGTGEKKANFNQTLNELVAKPTGCVQLIKEGNSKVALFGYCEDREILHVPLLRTKQYFLRQTLFIQNVNDLLKIAIEKRKKFIVICDNCLTLLEKEILLNSGFFQKDESFIRGIKFGILNSGVLKSELQDITVKIPELEELVSEVDPSNMTASYLHLLSLEKLLWPLKVFDADIPCFIIPIKPYYAKELFDTKAAKAELFGVQPTLIWSNQNVYFRNIQPNVEQFPARILWYASADRNSTRQMSIVCSSYLDEITIGPAKEMYKKYEKFGIYSWNRDIIPLVKGDPEKKIKVIKFSNSEAFNHAISLRKTKQILFENEESDNNFQSPLRIKSSTFMELYSLGKGLDKRR